MGDGAPTAASRGISSSAAEGRTACSRIGLGPVLPGVSPSLRVSFYLQAILPGWLSRFSFYTRIPVVSEAEPLAQGPRPGSDMSKIYTQICPIPISFLSVPSVPPVSSAAGAEVTFHNHACILKKKTQDQQLINVKVSSKRISQLKNRNPDLQI